MNADQHRLLDRVDDYVHGLLDGPEADRVEAFCRDTEAGRKALAAARARKEALESLPTVEAPESLVRSTVDRIEQRQSKRASFRRWFVRGIGAVTAAAVLIVAGFHWRYATLEASPYDVRIVGQSEFLAGSRAGLRVAVFDRRGNRPVASVPVTLAIYRESRGGYHDEVELAEVTTDEQGQAAATFELPDWRVRNAHLRVVAETDIGAETLTEAVELTRSWKVMLSTDKPVYKPGQTIRVRALGLRRPDLKPIAGEQSVFTVTDPKGNMIFRERGVTSEFGITSADCALATEIIEGPYTIRATIGDTQSAVTVDVEQYVLPKFAAEVELDAPFYAPGDRVRGSVQADYFFGQPVAEADVSLVVETPAAGPHRIENVETTTDASGKANFAFTLPERFVGLERHGGDGAFRVVATIIDTAGQSRTIAASRVVTAQPIRIEVVPEMGQLVAGVTNRVYVFTTRADGQPAATKLRVSGIPREIETSPMGVASFELEPEGNEVGLTLVATSLAEPEHVGRRHVDLQVGRVHRDFVVRTDKAVYSGGETMTVTVLGGGVEPVFLDFLDAGQTVLTKTVDVQDGRGTLSFDLPPELFGTLKLCAYRFGPEGLPVVKTRVVHVDRAGELRIAAGLDRETYRPGEQATLTVRVTDAEGNATPGAISLAAVDEAVFHVLKQRPGMEEAFFELERQLLEPIYAIYGSWQPALAPGGIEEEDVAEFEQALFARTTRMANAVQFDQGFRGRNAVGFEPMPALAAEEAMGEPDAAGPAPNAPGRVTAETESHSPLTLVSASYPAKKAEVEQRKRAGLRAVDTAWRRIGIWVAFAAMTMIFVLAPRAVNVLVGICIAVPLLMILLLPAVQQSREAARRAAAGAEMADMAEGGVAGEAYFAGEPADGEDADTAPVRVRQWFPETLLWRPEIVTDENGVATLSIPLADSITTWRLTASAVSADGRLGSLEDGVRVFQPFFVDVDLPVALVRNDEVAVPIVVYNYLDEPQTVELELADAEWFELLSESGTGQRIELGPGEVRSTHYRLRAKNVGDQKLKVTARAGGVADAVEREIAVEPDGRAVETVVNGSLDQPRTINLSVPEHAIPGSVTAVVKVYPSSFSQLVEGLDGIFQRPYGCFEQTSSTTYPNVLALAYLEETEKSAPEVAAKARQFIHLGYQRLLGFEVDGGGFDWFGNPPANVTLTAYGLMEFVDMAEVHDVDPDLIERTRGWLLSKRSPDGSWKADRSMLNDGLAGSVQRGRDLDLATTAYVGWAVFGNGGVPQARQATVDYLLSHQPTTIDGPYALALVANALLALEQDASAYVDRLVSLATSSEDGEQTHWSLREDARTNFYGSGAAGDVEVTALATLALLHSKSHSATARKALAWLAAQRGGNGTWPSTQATVLALKALILGTKSPVGGDRERSFAVKVDDQTVKQWTVPVDQAEVMQQLDVADLVASGSHSLALTETTDTGSGFQVLFRYHVPEDAAAKPESEPLTIDVAYDRTDLLVHDSVVATARVRNDMDQTAPMVIVDLPIPAGFRIDPAELEELKASGDIAKFQVNARSAVVYLRELEPGRELELVYRLEATMPVKLTVPPATVYEYYDPGTRGRGKPIDLTVGERT